MIPHFIGTLRIEEVGYEKWSVIEPFSFVYSREIAVLVPVGFMTDLASVPNVFGPVVPKIGYWSQPAVVHDYLYHQHREGIDTVMTRARADRIFFEGIKIKAKEYDVPLYLRRDWLIYGGVRAGGQESWMTPEEKEARKESMYPDED